MAAGRSARHLALRVLGRIDTEGAYANLALRSELDRSGLDRRDRAFATELVYGVTRLRRRLDHVVDRFLLRAVDPPVRAALRLGAYQLHELGTPAHAAVSTTVDAVDDRRVRGLVNAVLRKVAAAPVTDWPSDAVRLSYPDWIVERLVADLGRDDALAALEAMNARAVVHERDDGYIQDPASQWVAASVGAQPGERIADLCAAPGGKATTLAATGAWVAASDVRATRIGLVRANASRVGAPLALLVADGKAPPYRPGSFDRVLLDAPCTGLGTLRRRADARWRVEPDAVGRLATLQRDLLDAAFELARTGGLVVYSVCTLTRAEGIEVVAGRDADVELRLPDASSDGMFLARMAA
jgi:16S rRNA (cytosine967-C5)-methyltransferase